MVVNHAFCNLEYVLLFGRVTLGVGGAIFYSFVGVGTEKTAHALYPPHAHLT